MHKVCVKCQVEMKPHTNGVAAVEMASFGPYKLWMADKWECPQCGWQGIFGFSATPIEHFQEDFALDLERARECRETIEFWGSQREKMATP